MVRAWWRGMDTDERDSESGAEFATVLVDSTPPPPKVRGVTVEPIQLYCQPNARAFPSHTRLHTHTYTHSSVSIAHTRTCSITSLQPSAPQPSSLSARVCTLHARDCIAFGPLRVRSFIACHRVTKQKEETPLKYVYFFFSSGRYLFMNVFYYYYYYPVR